MNGASRNLNMLPSMLSDIVDIIMEVHLIGYAL